METIDALDSKAVKKLIKSTFVIIGILAVLSYGFATIVLLCNNSSRVVITGKDISGSSITVSGNKIIISVKDSICINGKDSSSITISVKDSIGSHITFGGKNPNNILFENKVFTVVLFSVLIGVPSLAVLIFLGFMIMLLIKDSMAMLFNKLKENAVNKNNKQ
jgi:hypothetical protein